MKKEFIWLYGESDKNKIASCKSVRETVFVDEQGFSAELEFDEIDAVAYHLLLTVDGMPVAAARIFVENGGWHAGRICIITKYRGNGIGLLLMDELARKVVELGGDRIVLSSQVQVRPFYEKAGYVAYGEEYLDEHCPHIRMEKRLNICQ